MSVRIGIISDTHDRISNKVLENLKGCNYILHAGDVTARTVLDKLDPIPRLYVVKGNNDYAPWSDNLRRKQTFEIEGLRFLMVHERFRAGSKDAENADVIIYGHTHIYKEEMIDGRLWLNPGSCSLPRYGMKPSMAIMTVDQGKIIEIKKILL